MQYSSHLFNINEVLWLQRVIRYHYFFSSQPILEMCEQFLAETCAGLWLNFNRKGLNYLQEALPVIEENFESVDVGAEVLNF